MKKVIITGATGMIGGIVLNACIASDQIEKVTSLVRRPSGVSHPKLVEIIHKDFLNYEGIEDHFKDQDAAYFCIGVYTGQVADVMFKQITVDIPKAFADTLKAHSPGVKFCFLSGQGADQKEKSRVSFAKYKGMAENHLISKNFEQLTIFRPGYIYPVEKREEPNIAYRIYRRIYPAMNALFPTLSITSEALGQAMFRAGLKTMDQVVLENEDIKKV